ncbi:MAG: phosphatidylserine/phosphatidylglycerophosphate/cardiolipin synthase family protein [Burkholderiales bacterium]|nr:phosphatidylserine/phosphatidylglycerophosphate/cardiolipin synthase family protein [Burkholderiales bacterium]
MLYRELGQLVAETPRDLAGPGAISAETHLWLGRAAALLAQAVSEPASLEMLDRIGFTTAVDALEGVLRLHNAHKIVTILHRALARAERNAPAAARGAFIPVGAGFNVFQVVGKVLSEARNDVLIVDAYMGLSVLTDFAPLAAERVAVRLLTDSFYTKPETLQPAAARWAKQYGAARPLELRVTAPRLLHDRLIVVDGAKVWSLTQSLKDFADRSPGSVLHVENEIANQKIHAYGQLWANAQRL